jgi:methionyl-tRNA formyltransferase
LRICFMGTPDFAIPCLHMLLNERRYEIVGVFTQPDRPKNRGKQFMAPPVKALAVKRGLAVYQYDRVSKEGVDTLRSLDMDVMVTVAYGQILSKEVLNIPRYGCINVHASLLPKYRGAAPIQWAIINGERNTGVTTMYTDIGVDTGDILLKQETPIGADETAGELFERLSVLGAQVLKETLQRVEEGTITRTPQDETQATHYPMLKKEHGRIDFHKTPAEIHNLVRGVSPWPGAYAAMGDAVYKIWRVAPMAGAEGCAPGTVLCADDQKGLVVQCAGGAVEVLQIQAPGGKRMDARAFLRGKKLPKERFNE